MNDQQINTVMAEAEGWRLDNSRGYGLWIPPRGYVQPEHEARHGIMACPPNYCGSLDALKRVIDKLRTSTGPQWFDFVSLAKDYFGSVGNCIVPDPKELAIVYVKALGKWRN